MRGGTVQSILINTHADRVWRAIRDFHDLDWAPRVITCVEQIGDIPGDKVGAQRVLNDAFHETLLQLDDETRTFVYSVDDGPSPVSQMDVEDYVARVSVRAAEDGPGTTVEWSSSWWPLSQAPTADFVHGIYMELLGEMKRSLE